MQIFNHRQACFEAEESSQSHPFHPLSKPAHPVLQAHALSTIATALPPSLSPPCLPPSLPSLTYHPWPPPALPLPPGASGGDSRLFEPPIYNISSTKYRGDTQGPKPKINMCLTPRFSSKNHFGMLNSADSTTAVALCIFTCLLPGSM